jgi:N-acetylglutamate synthase
VNSEWEPTRQVVPATLFVISHYLTTHYSLFFVLKQKGPHLPRPFPISCISDAKTRSRGLGHGEGRDPDDAPLERIVNDRHRITSFRLLTTGEIWSPAWCGAIEPAIFAGDCDPVERGDGESRQGMPDLDEALRIVLSRAGPEGSPDRVMSDRRLELNVVRALEERALKAWPSVESKSCGGWILRASKGFTKRANSASALAPSVPFRSVRPMAEIFYRGHRLPVTFRITPLAGEEPDQHLEEAGYRRLDPSLVMVARLGETALPSSGVRLETRPSAEWKAGIAEAKGIEMAHRALHERLLAAIHSAVVFATVEEGGETVGFGLAVADRGVVGLFDVVVAPTARRRGIGRRLASALLAWGRSEGAMGAYLQVGEANEAARSLYAGLGFEDAYPYHYRIRD